MPERLRPHKKHHAMCWIKIHRKILEWEWYHDTNMVRLFLHLLLKANYEDRKWRGITVKRGQLITCRKELSEATGLSEKKIRTCLARLHQTGEIGQQTTNKYSLITICNYDSYQGDQPAERPANGQQMASKWPANGQQTAPITVLTTSKEVKENNNNHHSARTREVEFFESLKLQTIWLEAMASKHKTSTTEILRRLAEFQNHCECIGKTHAQASDIKKHFDNWLRISGKERAKTADKNVNDLWQ